MKLLVPFGFFALLLISAPKGYSQEPTPKPETVLVNQKLVSKVEEVEKSALHIKSEDEGLVFLQLKGQSYAPKTQFVFFRRRGTRLQMIAMGIVERDRENPEDHTQELVVNIDKDTIVKYPQAGDFGVPLADPMSSALGENRDNSNTATVEEKPKPGKHQPGYLEFGMGLMFGQLFSDADPQTGGGKNSRPYRFLNKHFEYFSGLLPVGLNYESHGGTLPTANYSGDVVTSSESVSQLNFYYRPEPFMEGRMQIMPKLFILSDTLTTDNTGSELFTTAISATGVGARMQYRFASDVWKPEKSKVALQLLNVFGELGFSPFVSAKDGAPSRGTQSSGSTVLEYRLGGTMLMWFNFIPLLKRWVVQASYGARNYSLAFQGPTVSETGNPVTVPENIKTSESEKDYRFFVGIRFGDPIESLFSGDDKKKEDKK